MVYFFQNKHLAVQFVGVRWFIMGTIFTQKKYPLHKGETFISGNRNIIRCVPLKKRCNLFSLNKS